MAIALALTATTFVACSGGATIGGSSPPLATPSPGASGTATMTPSPSSTATATSSGSAAPTATASATATAKATATATASATATPVTTPTPSATGTASPSAGPTTQAASQKIYVVNHGQLGDNPSVTIYPATASGAATPIATIAGTNTLLAQPFFDVVDASGTIYVSNQSNTPGSQTAGYVTEYTANASGNVAPARTITGLHNPEGVALDKAGNLYVAVVDAIDVFAPGASGNAVPIRQIGGTSTTLQNLFLGGQPAGLSLDPAGNEFTAMGPVVLEFGPQVSGNVKPLNVYGGANGGNPATTGPPYGSATLSSCLGVAVDAADDVYCANFNNSSFAFLTSPTNPGVTIQSPGASMPFGIYVDPTGQVFVANYKGSSVQIFASMATFLTGVATSTISGAGTNLNFPYGVTAR